MDDGLELRMGVEHQWIASPIVPTLRAGLWLEPAHRLEYQGIDAREAARWLEGDDVLHFTAGGGLQFGRLRVDLGADFSESVDTVALSAVYRLGS
jgi:hypothetical protein